MKKHTIFKLTLKVVFVLTLFFLKTAAISQNEYNIILEISGKTDSTLVLASYFGDKFQMIDTTYQLNKKHIFSGNKRLSGGIYFVLNSKKEKLFELMINNDQQFMITSDSAYSPIQIKTTDNFENELFNKHLVYTNQTYEKISSLRKQIEKQKNNKLFVDSLNLELTDLSKTISEFRKQEISTYPNTYYAVLLKAMTEIEIPEEVKKQPEKGFLYLKSHYWDNFDLSDSRLLRTPLLPGNLETFIEKLTPPQPDSIIQSIDHIIRLTKGNSEVRDYLIWHFTSKYQYPKIMGLDKVFVYLSDNYFAKFEIANTTPSVKKKITEKAEQIRQLLIGNQAPDLWLIDTTGNYRSFKEIKSDYTVLFFWDQECNICKKDLGELKKLYESNKYSLGVYAICTNADLEGWKNYVRTNQLTWFNVNGSKSITPDFHDLYDIYSTPVIYILNKDKKIIAKRINVNQIAQVIQVQ